MRDGRLSGGQSRALKDDLSAISPVDTLYSIIPNERIV